MKANRPANKKRRREAHGDETLTLTMRSPRSSCTRSASQRGRLDNDGGPLSDTDLSTQGRPPMLEACSKPPLPGCPDPSAPEKPVMVEMCSEPPLTECPDPLAPAKPLTEDNGPQVPTGGDMLQNGDGSPTRTFSTYNQNTGRQSTGTNDLAVEFGWAPLSRPAQFRKYLLEHVSKWESLRWSNSVNLIEQVRQTLWSRGPHPDKVNRICSHVHEYMDLQREKGQSEIRIARDLAKEALFEFSHLEYQYQSLQSARSVLRKELQETKSVFQREKEALQKTLADLRVELVRRDLNADLEAATGLQKSCACHDVECGFLGIPLQQMTPLELFEKVLSLNETSRLVTEELQKRSQPPESSARLDPAEAHGHKRSSHMEREAGMEYQPGEADEEEQLRPLSGSYSDESATPGLLDKAICYAKDNLTRFQTKFLNALKKSAKGKLEGMLKPGMIFARPNHVSFHLKSVVNDLFFESFENESFNSFSGMSKFPDPKLRQKMFYEYYKDNTENTDRIDANPQFEDFYETRVSSLWRMFRHHDGDGMTVCSFQELGGSTKSGAQLAFHFRAAAKSVWLLHKLSFSFEPPACLFGVAPGTNIDPNYMETVGCVEENPRFVSKVGLMITPGMRLRNDVRMRCEVYLAAAAESLKVVSRRSRNTKAGN